MTFTQRDKDYIIKFLNLVATKATFKEMSVKDSIELYQQLNYFQTDLLKKIDQHLLEVIQDDTNLNPVKEDT